jgi:uncharacterized lipoprotein YajG
MFNKVFQKNLCFQQFISAANVRIVRIEIKQFLVNLDEGILRIFLS